MLALGALGGGLPCGVVDPPDGPRVRGWFRGHGVTIAAAAAASVCRWISA